MDAAPQNQSCESVSTRREVTSTTPSNNTKPVAIKAAASEQPISCGESESAVFMIVRVMAGYTIP